MATWLFHTITTVSSANGKHLTTLKVTDTIWKNSSLQNTLLWIHQIWMSSVGAGALQVHTISPKSCSMSQEKRGCTVFGCIHHTVPLATPAIVTDTPYWSMRNTGQRLEWVTVLGNTGPEHSSHARPQATTLVWIGFPQIEIFRF